jgi:protein-disulfide isomerase
MAYLVSQARHVKGNEDAPVTIIEFSDFQCPFCGRYATGAGHQIEEVYIANGQVRVVHFHFAFLGDESLWAAEAAECAGEQNAFWDYYDYLFSHQNGENQGAFSQDNLKAFAAELELDTKAFSECLDSGRYTLLVQNMRSIARQIGVQSTPTFAINGQGVVGAKDFTEFATIIDSFLAEEP